MTRLELLDSARHKLRLAGYHGPALLHILELHPTEDLEDDRRIEMEAHLEGLAYQGTAAAEKTLRSIDPESMCVQMSIEQMLVFVKAGARPAAAQEFGSAFGRWWQAEDQVAWVARELRNDAAHRVYEKAPDRSLWRMAIGRREIPLHEFAERYGAHLAVLADLVEQAEEPRRRAGALRSASWNRVPATPACARRRRSGPRGGECHQAS